MSWKLSSEVKHVNISSYCTEFHEVICVKVHKLFLTYSRGCWKWTCYMMEHNFFFVSHINVFHDDSIEVQHVSY